MFVIHSLCVSSLLCFNHSDVISCVTKGFVDKRGFTERFKITGRGVKNVMLRAHLTLHNSNDSLVFSLSTLTGI